MDVDRRTYGALATALFVDAVGFSMLAPMLPTLQQRLGTGDVVASVIFASFSGGLLAGFLVGALLVRRLRVRTVMAGAMLGHASAGLVIAFSESLPFVAAARTAQGLTSGILWIAAVGLTLRSAPWHRMQRLARLVAINLAGTLLGPAMGLFGDLSRPYTLHAGTLAVLAVVTALTIRSPEVGFDAGRLTTLADRSILFPVIWIALVAALEGMVHGSYSLLFGMYLPQERLALLYLVLGGAATLAAGFLTGRRVQDRAELLVEGGTAVAAGGLLVVALVTVPWVWFVTMTVIGFAVGVGESSALSLLGRTTLGGTLTALVAYSQSWAVGFLVGPPIGSALVALAGWTAPALATVLCAVTLATGFRVRARGRPGPSSPTGYS